MRLLSGSMLGRISKVGGEMPAVKRNYIFFAVEYESLGTYDMHFDKELAR